VTTVGEDPQSVQNADETPESILAREAKDAPLFWTALRASISLRNQLNTALTTMREMAALAKEGNVAQLKLLGWEAEALIAENTLMGRHLDHCATMPSSLEKVTPEFLEGIFGIQALRVAARDINLMKKVGR
jgi:hypothetical protein